MDFLQEFLKANGAQLTIAKDIAALQAIAEIREHWADLQQGTASPDPAAVIGFIEQLLDPSSAAKALEILNAAQCKGEELRAKLQGIANVFHKVEAKYSALVMPVTAFDEDTASKNVGLIPWKVLGVEKTVAARADGGGGPQPDYALDLGIQAAIALEAGDCWPDAQPDVPDPLLRIGFTGGLEVSAQASLPLSLGALRLGVDAAREASIDYYFDARHDQRLYAAAAVDRLGKLPNPWTLVSVMNALSSSDFYGAVFETNGHSTFTVDVSVADSFALTEQINVGADLKFSAKVKRSGTHYLKLRAVAGGTQGRALELTVERKRTSEREHAVALGIEFDLAELGRELAKLLQRHEGELQTVLSEYREFLTPGTYLKSRVSEILNELVGQLTNDAELNAALADSLRRTLGLAPAVGDSKLVTLLQDAVADSFDAASGVLTGAIEDVAQQLGDELTARTGLVSVLAPSVAAKLVAIVTGLRDELQRKVNLAIAKPVEQVRQAGKKNNKKADKLAAQGDGAFAVVRDAIGRYEQALKKLKDAVCDSARMKLTAKITAEGSSKLERTVDAKLTFLRASPAAIAIYRDVVRGDFDAILQLLDESHPDVVVDPAATTLTSFKATGRKFGYTLVLVGFEFGGSTVFDTSSKVLVEGTGKVSVLSELAWNRRTKTPRESREVTFIDSYELLAAKDSRDFSVGLGLNHEDEVLKEKEVEQLVLSFERAALVPQGTVGRALQVFLEWFGPGDRKSIVGDLSFAMRLESKEVVRLLCLGERAGDALTPAARRRIFAVVLAELVEAGAHTREHVDKLADIVHKQSGGKGPPPPDTLFDYTRQAHERLLAKSSLSPSLNVHKQIIDNLGRAAALNGTCMSFVELIDLMGDVFTAIPSITTGPGVWTVEEYDAAQVQINRYLSAWLKTGSRLFWIDSEAHPRTIAFIGALAALAQVAVSDTRSVMTLTMTRRTAAPATVTLC